MSPEGRQLARYIDAPKIMFKHMSLHMLSYYVMLTSI